MAKKGNLHTIKGKGFDANPQNINRKGAPRKSVSSVLNELKEKGVEQVSSRNIIDLFESLMNLTSDELKDFANDPKQPMVNRIVAKEMLNKKGFDIIEKMIERAHGKSPQKIESTNTNIDLSTITLEKAAEISKKIENDF